jgi:class 3 adenylate cyclase
VESVWRILADTEHLDRALGFPPTEPRPAGKPGVAALRVRARFNGLALEWEEEPFEFVEGRHYFVRRRMVSGPLREFNGGMRFTEVPGGTRVTVESELVPANAAGTVLATALIEKSRRDCDRVMEGVRAYLQGKAAVPYGPGADLAPPAVSAAARRALQGVDPDFLREPLAGRLCDFLAEAGEMALTRVRPFALARQWGADRYEVLRLCLRAARQGVLDVSWDLLCPNCAGPQGRWTSLADVRESAHCDGCQIRFDASFDQAVELTFRPNARYRAIEGTVYCTGGPGNTPHVVAQTVLAPGETRSLEVPLAPGRYRLRTLDASLCATLIAEDGRRPDEVAVILKEDALLTSGETAGAGSVWLSMVNGTGAPRQLLLERLMSYEDVATGAAVSVFQEFRSLFGTEALAPGIHLGIQTLPILFTDLQGSTVLYDRLGDASAYALVRDHFHLLQELVAEHGGGVVKTIGDAVMAAFPTTDRGLACALEINRRLSAFNRGAAHPLRLKIGLHAGPCIAARSYDERLDYFGSTVNLAARTHQESRGDDVVVTEAVLEDPAAAGLLAGVEREPFVSDLRGLGETRLVRLRPDRSPAGESR